MQIDKNTGLLSNVRYVASPNCDLRPEPAIIDTIIIHGISLPPGQFGATYIEHFFCNQLVIAEHPYFATIQNLCVSAHILIDRSGKITQFVPFYKRAWHAGQSQLAHRSNCNDFSIGIELEGTDDVPYEDCQYHTLAAAIVSLMHTYPAITRQHIVGHADVAPGRKTDPGPHFDWQYLDCILARQSLSFEQSV